MNITVQPAKVRHAPYKKPILAKSFLQMLKQSLSAEVVEIEHALLKVRLEKIFGYHLLYIGEPPPASLLECSPISNHYIVHRDKSLGNIIAEPEALPISTDSIDLVVLEHQLEVARDPHHLLREIDRILIPEGYLLILGINPFSLIRLQQKIRTMVGVDELPPSPLPTPYSLARVRDWISVLGFDCLETCYYHAPKLLRKIGIMAPYQCHKRAFNPLNALGSGYLIVARKRVSTMTLIGPRWLRGRPIIGLGLDSHIAGRGIKRDQYRE